MAHLWRAVMLSAAAGDIGYLHKNQHHFIVVSVDGNTVHSIDGNSGTQSEVKEGTHDRKSAFFYRVPV